MRFLSIFLMLTACLYSQGTQPNITHVFGTQFVTALAPGAFGYLAGTGFGSKPVVLLGGIPAETLETGQLEGVQEGGVILPRGSSYIIFILGQNTPLGNTTVVVRNEGGASSTPFPVVIQATSPGLNTDGRGNYFVNDPDNLDEGNPAPAPGNRLFITVDGLGAPPVLPTVQIDSKDITVFGMRPVEFVPGNDRKNQRTINAVGIQIPQLSGGAHQLTVTAGGVSSPPVTFTLITDGMITSQSGLTFNTVQGGGVPPVQTFSVLSGLGTFTYSTAVTTVSGGSWLTITPSIGTSSAGTAGSAIQVRANSAGLAQGTYYGTIRVSAPNVPNSPQLVTVVLNIAPANSSLGPQLDKTGLIFTGAPGAQDVAAQQISIFNPTTATVSFTTSINPPDTHFRVTSTQTTIAAGQSTTLTIQPTFQNVAEAVRTNLVLNFNNQGIRRVGLVLISAVGAVSSKANPAITAGCVPKRLIPVFTLLGDNFNIPAAWPAPVEATVVDDCGAPLNSGTVTVTFSNGDPVLRLKPAQNGRWTATWPPTNARPAGLVLTIAATKEESGISGTTQIGGSVSANPVPIVADGGVVETASYRAAPAPGGLISIFGSKLTTSTAQASKLPLPSQLSDTLAVLGGEPLPLIFTSDGQVNAVVPYSLSTNTRHQLVVQRGNALSVPQSVTIGEARPAVFSVDGSGQGQGHIYKFDLAGNQILASADSPARAGDVLVVYCAGLGAVTPAVAAGVAAPLTSLTRTVNPVTVKIQGLAAEVQFAGLTPGGAGLYQVNVKVPAGVEDNDMSGLVITVAGQDSGASGLAVRR